MTHRHDSGDPTCKEVFDLLSEYVDGDLSPELREALARHLEACPPCENFLRTFQKTRDLCRESLMEEMPEELRNRLRTFLRGRLPRK